MPRVKKFSPTTAKHRRHAKSLHGRNSRWIPPDSQLNPLKTSVVGGKPVMVFYTAKEVLEVEKTREDTEKAFLPTVEAVQNYELFRRSNFFKRV